MKYIALQPEQVIFESEEEAVAYYRAANDPEQASKQEFLGAPDPCLKILICKVECINVLVPGLIANPGGDDHFVDYVKAEAIRRGGNVTEAKGFRWRGKK